MPIVRMPDGVNVRFDDNMSKEQIKNMIAKKFPDFARSTEPKDTTTQFNPDALAQIEANNQAYDSGVKSAMRGLRGVADFITGTGEGINSGVDSVLNGASFGFYDKAFPEAKAKREALQRRAESVGLGTANKIAQGTANVGGMFINPLNYAGMGYIGRGANALSKAARSAGVGGAVGALAGAGNAENINELPSKIASGVKMGGAVGGALPLAGGVYNKIAPVVGKGLKNVLGFTTGTGTESVSNAYKAGANKSKVFLDNMRGKVSPDEVVGVAKEELSNMIEANSDLYRSNMAEAFADTTPLNVKKIADRIKQLVNKETLGGEIPLSGDEKKVLNQAYEFLQPAMKSKVANTTQGLDIIRQKIRGINTTVGENPDRIKKSIENAIKDEISVQRPEYREGLKQYAKNKAEIKEIASAFSLDKGKSVDTALRKLQSVGRNNVQTNYGYRNKLLNNLDFNGNITDAISGQSFNAVLPRGITARLLAGAGGINLSPATFLTSPRFVGEMAYGLGRLSNAVPRGMSPYLAQLLAENQ